MSLKNKNFILIAISLILLSFTYSHSITWQMTYPEFGNTGLFSIIQTSDKGYAGCGLSCNENTLIVIKFDSLGNVLWNRILYSGTGIGQSFGTTIREDENGNLVILANTELPPDGIFAFWLLGLDKNNGDTLWQYISPNDGIVRYAEDFDFYTDGYIVATISTISSVLRITKLNRPLTQSTERIFSAGPNSGFDIGRGFSRVKCKNDTIYIQATVFNNLGLYWTYFLKLKPNLDSVWIRRDYSSPIGGNFTFSPDSLKAVRFGTDRTLPNHQGVRIEKWNLGSGTQVELNIFPCFNGGTFGGFSVLNSSFGYVGLVGLDSNSLFYTDRIALFFLNYDVNLDTLFTKWFNAPSPYVGAVPRDFCNCSDGGYIISASAKDYIVSNTIFLIKTDPFGNSGVYDEPRLVSFVDLIKIFPNPSRGLINFQLTNGQYGKLKIYDALGRNIKDIEIKDRIRLELPQGIYFYRLKNQTGKIVILSP